MTPGIRPLVAGNWKMNGTGESLTELRAIAAGLSSDLGRKLDAVICVPATLLSRAAETLESEAVALGGQDCHQKSSGAHTGEISAPMLKEAGASHVILGHSERRTDHFETNALICSKTEAAWAAGLVAIVCVGETADERKAERTLEVIGAQLAASLPEGVNAENTIVAYEPVWAIGTGLTPTVQDVRAAHAFMREKLAERFGASGTHLRLLYGGSVKPSNAAELLGVADVDGALVGGASLKASDFLAICEAYRNL
ncbi:triose-phosphate isomerase [Falsochrobactrum shanghaiense]|uniref:Triosephosphate isomerase n=1 Tax=Falsochrobactrum shanghaiense TaxID=2201899 RepID=A0A316J9A1_9HYPH|nr:triose-phosphate isomerase [Falsochrobactrum shanghaiense]PWL17831.1 triose-phosphate isomerase [Falsochrobactrum shanghaiense]